MSINRGPVRKLKTLLYQFVRVRFELRLGLRIFQKRERTVIRLRKYRVLHSNRTRKIYRNPVTKIFTYENVRIKNETSKLKVRTLNRTVIRMYEMRSARFQ